MKAKCKILMLLILLSASTQATEFIKLNQQLIDNSIQVTPEFDVQISKKVRTAIENGIVITFVIQAKLFQSIDWWFDTKVESKIQKIQVRYFSLSREFQLHNTSSKNEINFVSLDQLIDYLGHKTTFNFKTGNSGDYIETRIFLDKQALPSIMQLPNVFDADWNLNSEWQRIPMTVEINQTDLP